MTHKCPDCGQRYDGIACVCQCLWLLNLSPAQAFAHAMSEDCRFRAPVIPIIRLRQFHELTPQEALPSRISRRPNQGKGANV